MEELSVEVVGENGFEATDRSESSSEFEVLEVEDEGVFGKRSGAL